MSEKHVTDTGIAGAPATTRTDTIMSEHGAPSAADDVRDTKLEGGAGTTVAGTNGDQSPVNSGSRPSEPTYECMKCHAFKPSEKFTKRAGMKRRPRRCDDCNAGVTHG